MLSGLEGRAAGAEIVLCSENEPESCKLPFSHFQKFILCLEPLLNMELAAEKDGGWHLCL